MDVKKNDRSLYMDISTYNNLREKGKQTVNVLNDIVEDFILPFNHSMVIDTEKINGRRKTYRFTKENWVKVSELLEKGEMQYVLLMTDAEYLNEADYNNSAISLSVTCDYFQEYADMGFKHPVTNSIVFSVSERTLKNIDKDIQDRWTDMFKKTFISLNGVNGYITFGYESARWGVNMSVIEDLLGLYYNIHSQHFNKIARGYFWGNMLSEGHIEQLGGIENIIKNAPCIIAEEIKFSNRTTVYLQLTPDINEYSDDQLRELKKFLAPVLPAEDMEKIRRADPNGKAKERSRLVFD